MRLLGLADAENLGPAHGAHALGSGPAVLQGYLPGIPNIPLAAALETIGVHEFHPP